MSPHERIKRKKLNHGITTFFDFTKMRINDTVLNRFRIFRNTHFDAIKLINQDTSKNDQFNVQRIDCQQCNTLFDELKSSTNAN